MQVDVEPETETIFDMKTNVSGRRLSASTNNNNTTTEPGSPKTVRSK